MALRNFLKGVAMNAGKRLFSQLMDSLPWSTFNCEVTRYSGDKGIRTLRRIISGNGNVRFATVSLIAVGIRGKFQRPVNYQLWIM